MERWSDAERRRTKRIFKNAPSLHEAMLLAEKMREIKLQNGYGYTINLSADVALESYHRISPPCFGQPQVTSEPSARIAANARRVA